MEFSNAKQSKKANQGTCIAPYMVYKPICSAQAWITQFNLQKTPCLPLPRKRSPNGASTDWSGEHLIAATNLSTPRGLQAELTWLVDLQQMVYPHNWSPNSWRSRVRQWKFAGQDRRSCHYATPPNYRYIAGCVSRLIDLVVSDPDIHCGP